MYLTIDGLRCKAENGEYVMAVARRNGVRIPSLCHHSALPGQACCRLCVVEALDGRGGSKTVTSCVYPVADGLEIRTKSEKLTRLRKGLLAILKERAPTAQGLDALCEEYGADSLGGRFTADPEEKCILCGLCVHACTLLGSSAIAAANRGVEKKIMTPMGAPSETCIGCGACACVCPTGAARMEQTEVSRCIWGKTFALVPCSVCGAPFATREQLDWIARREIDVPPLCDACKRVAAARSCSPLR